eukprot:NODE_9346_length_599_cov_62.594538_g8712_i0.p1 GENE.NODE_9346_length_599_cov_62.594538_g8712_i0~~NODE_9346_length_599_cov_62.594538_g8712_i0.p1  ORF type:complete len:138 (+),score=29.73 NODE_9346_length_599_cov_62.594538_g8712_i0:60-473(+)
MSLYSPHLPLTSSLYTPSLYSYPYVSPYSSALYDPLYPSFYSPYTPYYPNSYYTSYLAAHEAARSPTIRELPASSTPTPPPPSGQLPPVTGVYNQHRRHEEVMYRKGDVTAAQKYRERPQSQYSFVPEQERLRRRSL